MEEKRKQEALTEIIRENLDEIKKENRKLIRAEEDFRGIQRFILSLIILIILIWLFFSKAMCFTSMPTNDMYPRIDAGDLLLVFRLDKTPSARDVMMFEKNDTEYVSRVIAMPGDTIDITDSGNLVINGDIQSEPGIYYETVRYEGKETFPVTLKTDEYFVLSDRRDTAEDSRCFGPVLKEEFTGTVISVTRRLNL